MKIGPWVMRSFIFIAAACGNGLPAVEMPDASGIPVPYSTWPSNSGCWYSPAQAGSLPMCGCSFDPNHSNSTHNYGLNCNGSECTCFLDTTSTATAVQTADDCPGLASPALVTFWEKTCNFPSETGL